MDHTLSRSLQTKASNGINNKKATLYFSIWYSYVLCTFMITNSLYVDWMIALPVHIIVYIMMWRLDPNVCTINTTNHRRNASLQKKVVFDFLDLFVQRWPIYELIPPLFNARDTPLTVRDTVDLSTPTPTTCTELPDAKNLKATRTCCCGSSAWPRWLTRTKSSWSRLVM